MGGPYNIPRNYKGEGKILFIFSGKSFIYAGVGGLIGVVFYKIFSSIGWGTFGIIIMALLALTGFVIGTFKVPENTKFEFTKKTGGENIDDVIKRWIKFKKNKNKIYIYKEKEARKDG